MTEPHDSPTRMIDAHQHAFWQARDDRGLIDDMDAHGIEYAWLLTWEIAPWEDQREYHVVLNPLNMRGDGTHAGILLCDLILARDHFPNRFVLGYCPHAMLGDAPGLLRAAAAVHDIKVCGEWKCRIPCDDPRSIELFRVAGELRLPVVLHLDVPYLADKDGRAVYQPNWYGGTVDNLARALAACPDTAIIGHGPGFWREISADAETDPAFYPSGPIVGRGKLCELFESHPNLYADLSANSARIALERDPSHARDFLTRYSDRLIFGRDQYTQALHTFLQSLDLEKEAAERIYSINAEKLVQR